LGKGEEEVTHPGIHWERISDAHPMEGTSGPSATRYKRTFPHRCQLVSRTGPGKRVGGTGESSGAGGGEWRNRGRRALVERGGERWEGKVTCRGEGVGGREIRHRYEEPHWFGILAVVKGWACYIDVEVERKPQDLLIRG